MELAGPEKNLEARTGLYLGIASGPERAIPAPI
jgi:hypothetical protein